MGEKQSDILTRLRQARDLLKDAVKKKEIAGVLKDGFSVGASQISMLKSWSTDKDDKNPLIRTMSYTSSSFPYLAKNNAELKKFPRTLIAKVRDQAGNLTDANLKDARLKGRVRVSRGSTKWWLENGALCDDSVLKTVKFISQVGIRKSSEYNQIDFTAVTSGKKALTRKRVQTEIPVLEIIGKRSSFFNAVFEGNLDMLDLTDTDKEALETLNTKVLDLIQDPDDIVRIVSSLTNRKVKYIPLNNLSNVSLIEMRHAIESDLWQVAANNIPTSVNREQRILERTCGLLIFYALGFDSGAKTALISMLDKTFLGNETLSFILRRNEVTPTMLVAVCQAALGVPIPRTRQFRGVLFIRTAYIKNLAGLPDEKRLRTGIDPLDLEARKQKVVNYFLKKVNRSRYRVETELQNKMEFFQYATGYSEFHVRYRSSSAEIKLSNDKLDMATFQTNNKRDVIDMVASIIVNFCLWDENEVFPDLVFPEDMTRDKIRSEIRTRIYNFHQNPKKWPFPQTVEIRKKGKNQIQFNDMPVFKNIAIYDSPATSYGDIGYQCEVNETTLEVASKAGRGVEEYGELVFTSAESIRQAATMVFVQNKNFPSEIFSAHPVVMTKLGSNQKIIMLLFECFTIMCKYPRYRQAIFELSEESIKNLEFNFKIDDKQREEIVKFLDYTESRLFVNDFTSTFSCILLQVLKTNFYKPGYRSGFRRIKFDTENYITLDHSLFTAKLPNLEVGTLIVNTENILKVNSDSLFNLKSKQMLIGSNYFEYPNLKICENDFPHEQIRGVSIDGLKGLVGKHVILVGQCYEVLDIVGQKTIQEIVEDTRAKQDSLVYSDFIEIMDHQESDVSDVDDDFGVDF